MKYILIDEVNHDMFNEESDDLTELILKAIRDWEHLSEHDKKRRIRYCILKSINPDEDAENHFDGDVVFYVEKDVWVLFDDDWVIFFLENEHGYWYWELEKHYFDSYNGSAYDFVNDVDNEVLGASNGSFGSIVDAVKEYSDEWWK